MDTYTTSDRPSHFHGFTCSDKDCNGRHGFPDIKEPKRVNTFEVAFNVFFFGSFAVAALAFAAWCVAELIERWRG